MKSSYVVAIVFVFLACSATFGSDLENALASLEKPGRTLGWNDLQEATRIIRMEGVTGDRQLWDRLRHVVEDEQAPLVVRSEALKLACEKADDAIAREIISLLTEWATATCAALSMNGAALSKEGIRAKDSLVAVGVAEGAPYFDAAVQHPETLLPFLSIVGGCMQLRGHYQAVVALADSRAPVEMRRAAALEVVGKTPRYGVPLKPLLGVLGPEAIPQLRKLVRQSKNADEFHSHAAAILAQFGDEDIIPDLEKWRPILGQKSRKLEDYLKAWIWKIQVQHPPEKLVEYITSDSPRLAREWAVRRAVELGVPKSTIRQAVLTHVAKLKATGKREVYGRMMAMKQIGRELGVLAPDDLADVELREFRVEE